MTHRDHLAAADLRAAVSSESRRAAAVIVSQPSQAELRPQRRRR
jgi:hypothetical protein